MNSTTFLGLTWQDRKFLTIDRTTLKKTSETPYPSHLRKGLGLTHNATHLFITDGSNYFHILDRTTLMYMGKLYLRTVQGASVFGLTELELIVEADGHEYIWANAFQKN